MKKVQLTQHKVALVSDEDHAWAAQWKWCAQKQVRKTRTTWYAARNNYTGGGRKAKQQRNIRMHQEIAVRAGFPVADYDHRDGNTLNNQRENLRPATHSQNNQNRRKSPGCTSQFKGVSWSEQHGKWHARIQVNKSRIHLGFFTDEAMAAAAYNESAKKHFGAFALLNPV